MIKSIARIETRYEEHNIKILQSYGNIRQTKKLRKSITNIHKDETINDYKKTNVTISFRKSKNLGLQ